jgi:hypothetical protein
VDGALVPNTELGHLPLHHGDAEDWAAESIRAHDELSWKQYAHRLQAYLQLVGFTPDRVAEIARERVSAARWAT